MKPVIAAKNFLYKIKNRSKAVFGKNTYVLGSEFEGRNKVSDNTIFSNSAMGRCSYVGEGSVFRFTKIGGYCSIADGVSVCLGNHPTSVFATTHPAFYYDTTSQLGYTFHRGKPLFEGIFKYPEGENYYQLVIENDVWIGSNVLLLGGIRIGNGAVIAAGSVVTKDVPPYAIVGGNPAKIIRYRFETGEIERLLELKWWDWPEDKIASEYKLFSNSKLLK